VSISNSKFWFVDGFKLSPVISLIILLTAASSVGIVALSKGGSGKYLSKEFLEEVSDLRSLILFCNSISLKLSELGFLDFHQLKGFHHLSPGLCLGVSGNLSSGFTSL